MDIPDIIFIGKDGITDVEGEDPVYQALIGS